MSERRFMSIKSFFDPQPISIEEICTLSGASLPERSGNPVDSGLVISDASPIETASVGSVTFLDNAKYAKYLPDTEASAVFCSEKYLSQVPETVVALIHPKPYEAYGKTLASMFPTAMRPLPATGETGISNAAHVDPSARLEEGVLVEAGAVIGKGVAIGKGTQILAGAVIGQNVQIGRDCTIGMNVSVSCTLIGDRVIVHGGTQIGQDGFGFALSAEGHRKIPQVGRVIIQDDVEIGANCAIDRGANRDTILGEGTKLDNLVQIAHNVVIGRHCVLIALSGVAGSATLDDFVIVAAQTGIVGHVHVGKGAQIGGGSGVTQNVGPGEKVMGYPAIPANIWMREAAKQIIAAKKSGKRTAKTDE